MDFEFSDKVKDLQERLTAFMDEHVYPNEKPLPRADRGGRPLAAGRRSSRS